MFSCKSKLSLINTSGHESCDVGSLECIFLIKRIQIFTKSDFFK